MQLIVNAFRTVTTVIAASYQARFLESARSSRLVGFNKGGKMYEQALVKIQKTEVLRNQNEHL